MIYYLKKLSYYIQWFYKCKILNQKIPLTSSIILTDKCNLNCKHCIVANLGYKPLSFKAACHDIDKLFQKGARMLIITGGEPFKWNSNNHELEDLVKYAHQLGFFRIVVCTNGTYKLNSSADYLWVSLDGIKAEHDFIRGNIYDRVMTNINNSSHHNIYINFTISKLNYKDFEKAFHRIIKIRKIRGILFHLFTVYIGGNKDIELTNGQKREVLNRLYKLKLKHPIKVSNTFAGLRYLATGKWNRPIWGSITINRGELSICCCRMGISNQHVCRNCGCTPAVETWVLQEVIPSAILENLRFL
jgi:MoaA/NifB/PqqE/SkfB family radical SAM enzyme